MTQGTPVRLTKALTIVDHSKALPEAYTLDGVLLSDVAIGRAIKVWRHIRNGVESLGLFTSSPVVKIEGDKLHTNNSIWRLEILS